MSHVTRPSNMQRLAAETAQAQAATAQPIPLHAPDKPGELAHRAGQFAYPVFANLLVAQSATAKPEQRVAALEKLFTAWPGLCREMAALSEVAPNSAAAGRRLSADLRDFIEAREGV